MNKTNIEQNQINQVVHIPANGIKLEGALVIPSDARGISSYSPTVAVAVATAHAITLSLKCCKARGWARCSWTY
jgi:hypothetical protein